ncbi:class I mannose-6-phosphate isomerase [Streptomyces purpurogeneiscleroticus]|uniref:class I mannose-6-phosphate isomerase n=1 Tax=Streptomyces purpurogeneiscleroticus TaxID=68259 RepID=UPI001CC0999E|nr:class I mannose-6-phosphate isomerase [Streptomyces purpurogeneiscleroticus]MBZ4018999.1 mannose-6-phosphate isomerase [Streptomyces purpurogeneiscleroticus]
MDWYPLRLTTPVKQHVFGGRAIPDRLGRGGLPEGPVAETWEVSDVDGEGARIGNGALAGWTLRRLTLEHPAELVGRGWHGPRFPLLTKYIDGHRPLPVHLHPDDAAARGKEGEPNGKTEAWHILDAPPGATAYAGVHPGVDRARLRQALLGQDFASVLRRLPVRAGDTLYVPAGTLHSFGPDTLVYEIEQTSDLQQHAMRHRMEDGSPLDEAEWRANIEALLDEWRPEPRPEFHPGLRLPSPGGTEGRMLCAGPYFALERWRTRAAGASAPLVRSLDTAVVLSNAGPAVTVAYGAGSEPLGRAETLLLPAALGRVEIHGPADVLLGYLPALDRDVRAPLRAAGHDAAAIAALGEGLGRPGA